MESKYETLGEVLDAYHFKRIQFGRKMDWSESVTYMKLNRHRAWTVAEYERGLGILKRNNVEVTRTEMMGFTTKRKNNGNA